VGVWLARPSLQRCLRAGGWISTLGYYDVLITRKPLELVTDRLSYYLHLGIYARDALGRLASQCQRLRWIVDLLPKLDLKIDPWPIPPRPLPDPPPWLPLEELELTSLGGAVDALAERFGSERDVAKLVDRRIDEVEQVARRGAAVGVAELLKRAVDAGRDADKLLRAVALPGDPRSS
jgi:hypothetical protein